MRLILQRSKIFMNIKLFKKGDIAVIAVILAVAGIFALWQFLSSEKLTAVVTVNGEIVVEKGKIYFKSSECTDKLCVSCGKLEKKGDTAVCLPSKTVVTVIGSDLDAVTY